MKKEKDRYEEVITYIIENQDKFYRLAYSYVRAQEDALDIVQNAICKALENYETLKNTGALRTWFYRILVNESISYLRKSGRELQYGEPELLMEEKQSAAYRTGAGAEKEDMDGVEGIYQEIRTLPPELQNIIRLYYFENLTLDEVAGVLNLNVNTVKAKLYRSLKKMRVHMEEDNIWEN